MGLTTDGIHLPSIFDRGVDRVVEHVRLQQRFRNKQNSKSRTLEDHSPLLERCSSCSHPSKCQEGRAVKYEARRFWEQLAGGRSHACNDRSSRQYSSAKAPAGRTYHSRSTEPGCCMEGSAEFCGESDEPPPSTAGQSVRDFKMRRRWGFARRDGTKPHPITERPRSGLQRELGFDGARDNPSASDSVLHKSLPSINEERSSETGDTERHSIAGDKPEGEPRRSQVRQL